MLGVILTLVAVLLLICFAFCFSDDRGARADSLFFLNGTSSKRNPDRKDLCNQHDPDISL